MLHNSELGNVAVKLTSVHRHAAVSLGNVTEFPPLFSNLLAV